MDGTTTASQHTWWRGADRGCGCAAAPGGPACRTMGSAGTWAPNRAHAHRGSCTEHSRMSAVSLLSNFMYHRVRQFDMWALRCDLRFSNENAAHLEASETQGVQLVDCACQQAGRACRRRQPRRAEQHLQPSRPDECLRAETRAYSSASFSRQSAAWALVACSVMLSDTASSTARCYLVSKPQPKQLESVEGRDLQRKRHEAAEEEAIRATCVAPPVAYPTYQRLCL